MPFDDPDGLEIFLDPVTDDDALNIVFGMLQSLFY